LDQTVKLEARRNRLPRAIENPSPTLLCAYGLSARPEGDGELRRGGEGWRRRRRRKRGRIVSGDSLIRIFPN